MLDSKSHTIENHFRRNKEKILVRFADNWNDGIPPWRDGMMGSGLRLVEPTLRPVSLRAGSGLGEDNAMLD